MDSAENTIYYAHDIHSNGIYLLIPKENGTGFIRNPTLYKEKHIPKFINNLSYNCTNARGLLHIGTGFNWKNEESVETTEEKRELLISKISDFLDLKTIRVNEGKLLDMSLQNLGFI